MIYHPIGALDQDKMLVTRFLTHRQQPQDVISLPYYSQASPISHHSRQVCPSQTPNQIINYQTSYYFTLYSELCGQCFSAQDLFMQSKQAVGLLPLKYQPK